MQTITVLPGSGKDGTCEAFTSIELQRGKLYTIVGSTGSGKSRFIKDIEQLAGGDSITHRHVLLDNAVVPPEKRQQMSSQLVAHLGQNMRFVLDISSCERMLKSSSSASVVAVASFSLWLRRRMSRQILSSIPLT